jgi:hypothetical protein
MPRSSKWSLPFMFLNQDFVCIYYLSRACHMAHRFHSPWFVTLIIFGEEHTHRHWDVW